MKTQSKKKPPRKVRAVGAAEAKPEDFKPMTPAQLGESMRRALVPEKRWK